jgi:hypothetical protein
MNVVEWKGLGRNRRRLRRDEEGDGRGREENGWEGRNRSEGIDQRRRV